jgi:hypothetical protein
MPRLTQSRWIVGTAAASCLFAIAGCEAVANAPRTTGVCYTSNTRIDPHIVYESDCIQTGGTWERRAN